MKKALLVMRHEILITIMQPTFLLLAFGVPLISSLLVGGASVLETGRTARLVALPDGMFQEAVPGMDGYVDHSGLIQIIPSSISEGSLLSFSDEAAARQAVEQGRIRGYYVIAADYMDTGTVVYYQSRFNPMGPLTENDRLHHLIRVNLLNGDVSLAKQLVQPIRTEVILYRQSLQFDPGNPFSFFIPAGVAMLYYVILMMTSSMLLNSVAKEKENRVMEILMCSLTARQLIAGKLVGLGIVGLVQTAIWLGTGYALLRLDMPTIQTPPGFHLAPSFLAWGLLFFLLGYAIYAGMLAMIGALVPNLREASQAAFVVILPLLIPLMLLTVILERPDGALSVGLSLFPLTATMTMMTRLPITDVPLWQLLLSAGFMVLTSALIVSGSARLFRAQTLLSGQPFHIKRLLWALRQSR